MYIIKYNNYKIEQMQIIAQKIMRFVFRSRTKQMRNLKFVVLRQINLCSILFIDDYIKFVFVDTNGICISNICNY